MSGGKSESSSTNETFIDPTQMPFLQFLREQGQGLAQGQLGQGSDFQTGVLDPAMQAYQGFLNPQQDPNLVGQIQQGQDLITRNFQENLLPTIGSGAAAAGQRGSSRQGVAEGIALRGANETSANFTQNMLSQDFARQNQQRMQALGMAPQMGALGFSPLQNFSQLLGRPTILGQGESNSKSMQMGF